jgi:FtsZ-interacting cell division protein ZipA
MTTLQLGLIVGGIVLVVGVIIYNWIQERRARRRIASTFTASATATQASRSRAGAAVRVEPTLRSSALDAPAMPAGAAENPPRVESDAQDDEVVEYVHPVEFAPTPPAARAADEAPMPGFAANPVGLASRSGLAGKAHDPDPDVECIIMLEPQRLVGAGELAAGLHARVGKPLRWLGRTAPGAPWQLLGADTTGAYAEIAACLLLADRAGAVTRPLIDRFVRMVREIAVTLPAELVAPDALHETERAEALDRICADLDVQIGLTVLKTGPGTIAGTRLRGVAEAAGFRLSDSGRFEWVQEDTGAVLYSLQNYRSEPFTIDSLRLTSTPGAVFVLDVPRVNDPVRVFDQMKLAAKRMTQTLDAALVDDNRRPLDDAALASIRVQVQATATALKEINVSPGSPRALALFGG